MKPDGNVLTRRRALKTGIIGSATALGLTGIVTANGQGKGQGGRGGPGNVDIEFSDKASGTTGQPPFIAANPTVDFSKKFKLVPAISFDVENKRTGDSLTVSVDSNQVPDALSAILDINDADGTLKQPSREDRGVVVLTPDGFVKLDYTVSGDITTLADSAGVPYDEFQVTMGIGGSEVDDTSDHLLPIKHQIDYSDAIVDNGDTYRFSFNANGLPTDPRLQVAIRTTGGRVTMPPKGDRLEYDSGRYMGEIEINELPSTEIDVLRMTVRDSSTNFIIISLAEHDISI